MFYNRCAQLLILCVIVLWGCTSQEPKYEGPLSPKASINTFHFAEAFKAELFAAEPLVKNPVAMRFDEQGTAYVVEMGGFNKPDSIKGRGRIVVLKDTDGDGQADQSVTFADGLTEPTSILPWEGGLIVTVAPDILYLKDTNGDGEADSREVLFSGFYSGIEERQISNLRFSVDNWIYINNLNNAGTVSYHRKPNAPKLPMQGADFRFRLDRNEFERATGPGQFGQAINDWGHRFITQNTQHIRQVVIPIRYLQRNPYIPPSIKKAQKNISDHDLLMYQLTPAPYWRAERARRRNKRFQEHDLDRVEYAKDHFTGASGGTFYGGNTLPKKYYGSIFTGDVSGNLVHRDILVPRDGSPFVGAKRGKAEQTQEFLASTDPWFRPVNFAVGPNGYLYVIDMYQQHIEANHSIPEDLKADMDFSKGDQRGRIYRIVPKELRSYRKRTFNLKDSTSLGLVKLLSSPSRWWRLQAHKLLVERQDQTVIPPVKALYNRSNDPRVRLQALYVLEGLDRLNAGIIKQAMKDSSAGVRENGALLSERFPELLPQLKEMIADSSPRVALQATLSLGAFTGSSATAALAIAVNLYGQNPWFRTAILSSKAGSSVDLLYVLMREGTFFHAIAPWKSTFLEDLSYVIGNRNTQVRSLLNQLSRPPLAQTGEWQLACMKGLTRGLENSEQASPALKESLQSIETESGKHIEAALQNLTKLMSNSSKK